MFDVEPVATDTADVPPPDCAPPASEIVDRLNTMEIRVSTDDGAEGAGNAGGGDAEGGGGEGEQKVTPWEVEVRLRWEACVSLGRW